MDSYQGLTQKYQPDIYKKLKDPRADLSTTILSLRLSMRKDLTEMAELLKMSERRYLKLEYGDLDVTISEYNQVIRRMRILKMSCR